MFTVLERTKDNEPAGVGAHWQVPWVQTEEDKACPTCRVHKKRGGRLLWVPNTELARRK
jgi:hypothetical protein